MHRDDAGIRAMRCGGRVNQHVVKLALQIAQQETKRRLLQQFDRIGRPHARRQQVQIGQVADRLDDVGFCAARQDAGQAGAGLHAEQMVQTCGSQVGVDQ